MKTLRWMMLGAMLGFVASSAVSCGGAAKCGPKDCPFGCCDAAGTCQLGSTDAQCGAQGQACMACGFAQRCNLGVCGAISGTGGSSGQGGGTSTGGGGGSSGGGGGTTGGGGGNVTGGGGGSVTGGGGGNVTGGGGGSVTGGGGGSVTGGGGGSVTGGGGGSVTGGGGGATGGGGGSACTGCLASGSCVPLEFTSVSACGRNGATCQQCGPSQTCTGGICTDVSTPDAGLTFGNARVRLANGDGMSNGRLEAYINGAWGQVCDDYFDQNGVDVVCGDLGFSTGTFSSTVGPSGIFVMDNVVCQGTETTIQMCQYTGQSGEDCSADESLFIQCM